ncbi:hypothetical protein C8K36_101169 [Rhodococcus sp. OK519]|nr:hypothetical protein C8K36_101169 [Rhodococcus sp. OK519]
MRHHRRRRHRCKTGGAVDLYLREHDEQQDCPLVAMAPRSMRKIEDRESANQLVGLAVDMRTSFRIRSSD